MERTLCFGSLPGRLARSGFSALVLQEKVIRVVGHIINLLLTELVRSRLVDTGLFSFAFLPATSYRSVPKKKNARTQKQKKSIANIQTSWPHAWSKTHICWTSITLSPCYEISELSGKFPRAASFCCCRFSPSVPSLMHKAAFARDHSYLAPKGLTIAPH